MTLTEDNLIFINKANYLINISAAFNWQELPPADWKLLFVILYGYDTTLT